MTALAADAVATSPAPSARRLSRRTCFAGAAYLQPLRMGPSYARIRGIAAVADPAASSSGRT